MKKSRLIQIIKEVIREQETAIENAISPDCAQDNLWIFGNLQVPGFDEYYNVPTMNTVCSSLCVTQENNFNASEEEIEHTCGCCEEAFDTILPTATLDVTPDVDIGTPESRTKEDDWWGQLTNFEKKRIMRSSTKQRR